MPHLRLRYLESNLQKDMSWSPVVSVLGMRQVGKSTLLRRMAGTYITLDEDERLRKLERGDWSEIESGIAPIVIDEAQKSPGLFDRVKFIVDRKRRPGQFILTGSIRFLSRSQIRESLTGRTSLLELLPLTLAESHSKPFFSFIEMLTNTSTRHVLPKLEARKHVSLAEVKNFMELGGMPGVCFKRDSSIRERIRESHIETLLTRDLQFLVRTKVPFIKLRALLSSLAQKQGQNISFSELGREVQLSTPTVTQLIRGFENLFILRSHGKTYFFTDCGMASYLGAHRIENPLFHMERFVHQELYAQIRYSGAGQVEWYSYSTRGGVHIPFVIEKNGEERDRRTVALVVDPADGATEKSLKGLTWFFRGRKTAAIGVVLHQGKSAYIASNGAFCIPFNWIV